MKKFDAKMNRNKNKKQKTFMKRKSNRPCYFCENKEKTINFKDIETLNRFQSERGKIQSVKQSALCAKHQRLVTKAIKRAREIGLLSYTD